MIMLRHRLANEMDAPALLSMMEPFNLFEGTPWNAEAKARALGNLLRNRELGVVALLESEEGPIGYFVLTWGYDLEWDGRDSFLTELFVLPAARGIGNGRLALRAVETVAREHGARALHLMVRSENTTAKHLYTSHGYTTPPRLFLSKELAAPSDLADATVPE